MLCRFPLHFSRFPIVLLKSNVLVCAVLSVERAVSAFRLGLPSPTFIVVATMGQVVEDSPQAASCKACSSCLLRRSLGRLSVSVS